MKITIGILLKKVLKKALKKIKKKFSKRCSKVGQKVLKNTTTHKDKDIVTLSNICKAIYFIFMNSNCKTTPSCRQNVLL